MERKYYIHLIGGLVLLGMSAFIASFLWESNTEYVVRQVIMNYNMTDVVGAFCSMFYLYFGLGVTWYILFCKGYRNLCVFLDGVNDERRKNKKENNNKIEE